MTREEAKNILTSVLHTDGAFMDYLDSEDVEAIKVLASDERPHGEWVENGHYTYCSECGEMCGTLYDFCPNCGSDNRPKEGEEE